MIAQILAFIPGVFGLKGMLFGAAIALAAGGVGGWMTRDAFCDAAALRVENARMQEIIARRDAIIAEKDRQIADATEIQKQDAERALALEIELRRNQEEIDATPNNPVACLDRDATGRVRRVR